MAVVIPRGAFRDIVHFYISAHSVFIRRMPKGSTETHVSPSCCEGRRAKALKKSEGEANPSRANPRRRTSSTDRHGAWQRPSTPCRLGCLPLQHHERSPVVLVRISDASQMITSTAAFHSHADRTCECKVTLESKVSKITLNRRAALSGRHTALILTNAQR